MLEIFVFCLFFLSLQSVSNDIAIVWRIFSLPVLEPLTRTRLEMIVSVTMSCVYASVAAVTTTNMVSTTVSGGQTKSGSTSKDDETDAYASTIVQKTVSHESNVLL
jgi:E3 ubiquitin-protein ligases UBR4 N-terminal